MDSIFGKLVTGTFHVGALGFPDTVKLSGQVSITCDYRCEHTFKDFFYYENTAYWALHVLIDADPHYSLVNVETTKCHSYIPQDFAFESAMLDYPDDPDIEVEHLTEEEAKALGIEKVPKSWT